jgi:hypothetical protein
MPSKSRSSVAVAAPISWATDADLRHAALAAAFSPKEAPIVTTVSAPAITGLAMLERANAILSALDDGKELSFSFPGELAAVRAGMRELIAQAQLPAQAPAGRLAAADHAETCGFRNEIDGLVATCACRPAPARSFASKGTPRPVQPGAVTSAAGKLLPKMWHVEAFGPFLVGDTTKVGWVIRDTRTGEDEEFGRGKDFRAQAKAQAAEMAAELDPAERAEMEAVAKGRIVNDGRYLVAR